MGCMQSVPLPDPVAKFFHGKPMTPELQASLEAVLSDDFELRFVGEFVPGYAKPIVLDKSSMVMVCVGALDVVGDPCCVRGRHIVGGRS